MKPFEAKRILSALFVFVLATALCLPASALAAQTSVQVDGTTLRPIDAHTVSKLFIDDVDAPETGTALDGAATVTTAEGETWDVPVLWIGDDLQLAIETIEGRNYLPAIAFYLPDGLSAEPDEPSGGSGAFTVTLSDSLTELFRGAEVVSVYNEATGITYLLPASLRDFFATQPQQQYGSEAPVSADEDATIPAEESGAAKSLIDIYCSQTAKDEFSQEDLEYLIDLIINKLEPQAVELLLDSFPAFRAAADNGEIGTQIGLYIYYKKGDDDGKSEHTISDPALAYVSGSALNRDGAVHFYYIIAVDLDTLAKKDTDENLVRNPTTGKLVLIREGEDFETLQNTIVHELFHAIMYDYNRTGMVGTTNLADMVTKPDGSFVSKEQASRYNAIHFPMWFVEGTASMVENNYQFRIETFERFRADASGFLLNEYTDEALIRNYVNGTYRGETAYFDLGFAAGYDADDNEIDSDRSRYVSGYLACMYLSELAARQSGGSSITTAEDGSVSISSTKIRMGLNSILESLHYGKTLNQVVKDISTVGGTTLYKDAADFESKFIKGVGKSQGDYISYQGDAESLKFVRTFLNYMLKLDIDGRSDSANGSVLFDFDEDFTTPLDPTKNVASDTLKVVESNELVQSTVPDSIALAGGGLSASGTPAAGTSAGGLLQAAKTPEAAPGLQEEPVPEQTVNENPDAAIEPPETNDPRLETEASYMPDDATNDEQQDEPLSLTATAESAATREEE